MDEHDDEAEILLRSSSESESSADSGLGGKASGCGGAGGSFKGGARSRGDGAAAVLTPGRGRPVG